MDDLARTALRTAGGLAGAGLVGIAYAAFVERTWFTLRRFAVPALPPGAAPVRILQVSDLHLTPGQTKKIDWVRSLAELDPDFVVNSGDNLAHLDAVPPLLRAMEPLLERPGAFVLGSNDYFAPTPKNPARYLTSRHADAPARRSTLPVKALRDGLGSKGWADLNNARRIVRMGDHDVELVGVNDPHIGYDRYAKVAGSASTDVALTMGLVHAPYQRVLDAMVGDGASVVLAGHTHGGQLAVPLWGALVTNCDLDTRRAKGVSRWWPGAGTAGARGGAAPSSDAPEDAAWLHVSAGLGTSPYAPVRFACRPEATLLTLLARDS
ncbi:metallophosphoesterase [Ornithinibacter sp.]|jgi:predicted MPP superfamily phosphohydrolase|uniref:metallophosphoesterase n=1 Tax=Ornithinibacter sp. TaxID=2862748 RepID=UPI001B59FB8F|nr:metallophosphoesterase [Ornithinibacter sp.]MBP6523789.1 metallophosphoesterase [Dermatophilaceae bacterium]MBU9945203.1 metallophosphoesterase [Dermatophilaceae bacterium]HQW73512.1 metallophosphoesterase [Ornithinibacter sp.]HQX86313.1 metallophosphoesterase [Ornithinibacter sp.]HQZ10217.1 metallophosphoesterase [Ornithinibacter sp.]